MIKIHLLNWNVGIYLCQNTGSIHIRITNKGFSGTTVKDIWTKPRGRVEASEGGGFGWVGGCGGGKMKTTVIEQQ